MFDRKKLEDVLALHDQSYALLRWVKESLAGGRLSFSVVHDSTDSAEAAVEWVRRHYDNLPADAKPPIHEIRSFASLFVSYLMTSFRLKPAPKRPSPGTGFHCDCPFCSRLGYVPYLEARNPDKKDVQTAEELKRIYLTRLAEDLQATNVRQAMEAVLSRPDLAESIAAATWGAELVRRSEFTSQGVAVLVLWRQFAWRDGRLRRKFRVTVEMLLNAERTIARAMAP